MKIKTLVVIILRLYTIYLLVGALAQFAIAAPTLWQFVSGNSEANIAMALFSFLALIAGTLILAAVLWLSTLRIASLATKGLDGDLLITSLKRDDFYAFAFVLVGAYFALSSIYPVVDSGFKFFTKDFPLPENDPLKGHYLPTFLGHTLTLIIGFIFVYRANHWSQKLIRREQENPS